MNRWLVDAIAVYRLTRLATADDITQPIRDRIIEAAYVADGRAEAHRAQVEHEGDWQHEVVAIDPTPPKLATLVTCRWCASIYIAAGVLVVRRQKWWPPVADALAFSAGAALLARLEDD